MHATVDAAAPEASVEQVDPKALSQQDPLRPLRIPTTPIFLIEGLWTAIDTHMLLGWNSKGS